MCTKGTEAPISECFPDKQLFIVQSNPWYIVIVNYLITGKNPKGWNKHDMDRFLHWVKFYIWDDPYLFKYYSNQIVRRSVPDHEIGSVLSFCRDQPYGGTSVEKQLRTKYFSVDFIGPLHLKMPMIIIRIVLDVSI